MIISLIALIICVVFGVTTLTLASLELRYEKLWRNWLDGEIRNQREELRMAIDASNIRRQDIAVAKLEVYRDIRWMMNQNRPGDDE